MVMGVPLGPAVCTSMVAEKMGLSANNLAMLPPRLGPPGGPPIIPPRPRICACAVTRVETRNSASAGTRRDLVFMIGIGLIVSPLDYQTRPKCPAKLGVAHLATLGYIRAADEKSTFDPAARRIRVFVLCRDE